MVMAVADSVTVSIAELMRGQFNGIFSVNQVFRDTSLGRTADSAGTSRRSSKVSAISILSGNIGNSFFREKDADFYAFLSNGGDTFRSF
jgi:hypothetical protein